MRSGCSARAPARIQARTTDTSGSESFRALPGGISMPSDTFEHQAGFVVRCAKCGPAFAARSIPKTVRRSSPPLGSHRHRGSPRSWRRESARRRAQKGAAVSAQHRRPYSARQEYAQPKRHDAPDPCPAPQLRDRSHLVRHHRALEAGIPKLNISQTISAAERNLKRCRATRVRKPAYPTALIVYNQVAQANPSGSRLLEGGRTN